MQKKVAYIFSQYPVVSQTFCDSEILELERQGNEVVIISLNSPKTSFRHERLKKIKAKIFYPPQHPVLSEIVSLLLEANSDLEKKYTEAVNFGDRKYGSKAKTSKRAENAVYFGEILRNLGIAHSHVHFANKATHTAMLIRDFFSISFSFTAHAQDFLVDIGSELLIDFCKKAKSVVAVSNYSQKILQVKGATKKAITIYNGLDFRNEYPQIKPAEKNDIFTVVSIGRLIDFKGFDDLVHAMSELKDKSIVCKIIGDGPNLADLRDLISTTGAKVELLGLRSQDFIKKELSKAHCFALASKFDSNGASDILPTVIIEAMAMGLPIVSTDIVGIPEIVFENGFLSEPNNPNELAKNIFQIYNFYEKEKDKYNFFVKKSRVIAEDRFDIAKSVKKLKNLFPKCEYKEKEKYEYLVLFDNFSELELLEYDVLKRNDVVFYGCNIRKDDLLFRKRYDFLKDRLFWLADGMVLESVWENNFEKKDLIEKSRSLASASINGELFFLHARRVAYILDFFKNVPKNVVSVHQDTLLSLFIMTKILTNINAYSNYDKKFSGSSSSFGEKTFKRLCGNFTKTFIYEEKYQKIGLFSKKKLLAEINSIF